MMESIRYFLKIRTVLFPVLFILICFPGSLNSQTYTKADLDAADAAGMEAYKKGDYNKMAEAFGLSVKICVQLHGEDNKETATRYNNLGLAYESKGEYDKAIGYYQKALVIDLKKLGAEHPDTAIDYNNLGGAYDSKGEYDQAIAFYQKAISINMKKLGPEHVQLAKNYNNLGGAYRAKSEYDQAKEYYQKALSIGLKTLGPEHPEVAVWYNNLGEAYRLKNENDKALAYYRKALVIFVKVLGADHPNVAKNYNNLGLAYESKGDYDQAIEYFQKAISINKKKLGPEHPQLTKNYSNLGSAYRAKGEHDQAIGYYKKALTIVLKSDAYQQAIDTAVKLGLLYLELNLPVEARKTFNEALSVIDTARTQFTAGKTEFTARNIHCYYYALKSAALMKDDAGVFDVSESMRARGFLDRLSLSAALSVEGISPTDRERMLALSDAIESLTSKRSREINKPADKQDNKTLLAISEELQNKTKEFADLDESLLKNEKYRDLRKPRIASLKDAQNLCTENTAILEYIIWENNNPKDKEYKHKQSYCLVITKKSARLVELDRDFAYSETIRQYRDLVMRPKKSKKRDDLGKLLYAKLMAPIEKELAGAKHLIVVPDGSLAFLPFDALHDGEKYLCEKYTVTLAPSVSVLMMTKDRKYPENRSALLAFGGAYYSENESESRGQRSGTKTRSLSEKAIEYNAKKGAAGYYEAKGLAWDNLSGSREEVEELNDKVYAKKGTLVFRGKDVSEARVKKLSAKNELKDYRTLHFAVHGYYDQDVPAYSAVVLSEVSGALKNTSKEDGYLSIEEVALLKLQADIVNLSACETGLGKIVSGDGVVGLTRAFNVAGANRVGVTLWQVHDEATRDFMVKVYTRAVKQGKGYRAAYSETKREFLRSKKYREPYYWSPFVLYGE